MRAKNKVKSRYKITTFTNPSGRTAYRVSGTKPDGERVRENHGTEQEAATAKSNLELADQNLQPVPLVATKLTPAQIADAELAAPDLRPGVTFRQVVKFFNDNWTPPTKEITVSDAVKSFVASKKQEKVRDATLRNLDGRLKPFVALVGQKLVSHVTKGAAKAFIERADIPRSGRSKLNDFMVMHNFFGWCREHEYIVNNPLAELRKPRPEHNEVQILTVGEVRKLLIAARDHQDGIALPHFVVSLFCGIRPREISRLSWDNVDLVHGVITISSAVAKTRSKRLVKIAPNAGEWLAPFALKQTPLNITDWTFKAVRQLGGLSKRQSDINRHSAISYKLADCKDEGMTAMWAGNSPQMIFRHYHGLVKDADAKAFWNITPANVEAETIPMPAQAVGPAAKFA